MSDQYLHLDAQFVKAEIAKLVDAHPELAEDEALRLDTIEGETNAYRIIERALEQRQEAEMMAGAVRAREVEMAGRRGRFERKSEAMKTLIRHIMKAARVDKLQLPEATLSISQSRSSVGIEDPNSLPQGFYKRVADKAAIKAAFDRGEDVPGAILVLGSEGLAIRTK